MPSTLGALVILAILLLLGYLPKRFKLAWLAGLSNARPAVSGPIDLDRLSSLIARSDHLEVLSRDPKGGKTQLFETSSREDITQFGEALRLQQPDEWFHCMCDGDPAIHLYRGLRQIGRVSFHHGTSIRSGLWETDVPFEDPEPLLRWFDVRGISGPRRKMEEAAAMGRRDEEALARWNEAVPAPLRSLWAELRAHVSLGNHSDPTPLRDALARAVPGTPEQIRGLLAWFGSGSGLWSGFPAYEVVPEDILLTYTTTELLEVAESPGLTEVQVEGAARLFGGWNLRRVRAEDLKRLSPALRARLLVRALASDSEDKHKRARNAFVEQP